MRSCGIMLCCLLVPAGCTFDPDGTPTGDPESDFTPPAVDPAPDPGVQTDCDSPLVLVAAKSYDPSTWYHDDRTLEGFGYEFERPDVLSVSAGDSGTHCAFLDYWDEQGDHFRCSYKGPATASDRYDLEVCRAGNFNPCNHTVPDEGGAVIEGVQATATRLMLVVDHGNSSSGLTEVTLELQGSCVSL
jgi:hypothetical protein